MRTVHFLNFVLVEETRLHDAFGSFTDFFGALENTDERTGEISMFSHVCSRTHEPGLVTVVAAGVSLTVNLGAPFFSAKIFHLECVDVSAETDGLAGQIAFNFDEQRAGASGVIHVFGRNIVFFKEFLDFSDGSLSFEAAVRMLMDIVTVSD